MLDPLAPAPPDRLARWNATRSLVSRLHPNPNGCLDFKRPAQEQGKLGLKVALAARNKVGLSGARISPQVACTFHHLDRPQSRYAIHLNWLMSLTRLAQLRCIGDTFAHIRFNKTHRN